MVREVSVQLSTREVQPNEAQKPRQPEPQQAPAEERTLRGVEEAVAEVSRQELQDAIEKLQKAVSVLNHRLSFSIDDTTGRLVTKIIDNQTNEVIREVPPERVLAFVRRFQEFMGLLLDELA